jgi:hypothetical protein
MKRSIGSSQQKNLRGYIMNRIISWFSKIHWHQIITAFLIAITFVFTPVGIFFSSSSALAAAPTKTDDSYFVDSGTVKRIQQRAEDLGGEKIGDTGLKNIRELGENIPETIDLNVRNTLDLDKSPAQSAKEAAGKVKSKVNRDIQNTKRAAEEIFD